MPGAEGEKRTWRFGTTRRETVRTAQLASAESMCWWSLLHGQKMETSVTCEWEYSEYRKTDEPCQILRQELEV